MREKMFTVAFCLTYIVSACDGSNGSPWAPRGIGDPPADNGQCSHDGDAWHECVQILGVVPLESSIRDSRNITVNGFWGLIDRDPVADIHSRGEYAVFGSQGIAAEPGFLEDEHPELKVAVSKDVYGQDAPVPWYVWLANPPLVLSIAHPAFRDYLVNEGKRMVDMSADGWFMDEIQSSAAMIWPEALGGGFSDAEMGVFVAHLAEQGFASFADYVKETVDEDIGAETTVAEFLRPQCPDGDDGCPEGGDPGSGYSEAVREAVFDAYLDFHRRYALDAMGNIVHEVKDYAASKGRSFSVGANVAGMGNQTDWSPLAAPIWGQVLDYVLFEQELRKLPTCDPEIEPSCEAPEILFGREGSFAPYYRLGRAIFPGFVAALPGLSSAETIYTDQKSNYLAIRFAEAFAFEGNWGLGYWGSDHDWTADALAPAELSSYTAFVRSLRPLYEGPRAPGELAVVYSEHSVISDPGKHDSFLGLCHALGELNVQYDVIYLPDGYVRDGGIDAAALGRYSTVLVPSAVAFTDTQRREMGKFATGGGTLIALGPVDPGLNVTAKYANVGREHRAGKREKAMTELKKALKGLQQRVRKPADRGVMVAVYERNRNPALVVHLVNQRYTPSTDAVESLRDVDVEIVRPQSFDDDWRLFLYRPGHKAYELPYAVKNGVVGFSVPALDIYAVATFMRRPLGASR